MLLKHGAYDVFKEEGAEADKKFCEDSIDAILSRAKVRLTYCTVLYSQQTKAQHKSGYGIVLCKDRESQLRLTGRFGLYEQVLRPSVTVLVVE